jgi:hypothetical protein
MTPRDHIYTNAEWGDAGISIKLARETFQAYPRVRQEEIREEVRRLLLRERLRGQNSPSYLRQHAREIYGI